MSDQIPSGARISPSVARNRGPILSVLQAHLPKSGIVLEIAAGTGEHAVHCAASLRGLQWQPTDPDPEALASISAWRDAAALPNLLAPLLLDAAAPNAWPITSANAIVNINMIHISPWEATQGLMNGASRILATGDPLFLYGPYIERDVDTAPSNLAFDQSLRDRNPQWGIRHLEEVTALARQHGLKLCERVAMPANNLALIFQKTS